MLDANHHTEDFTFVSLEDKHEEHAHFELHRIGVRPKATSAGVRTEGK
jgi:hypothetical protein